MKLLFLFLDLAMIIIEDVITQNSMLKQVLVILVIVLRHYIDSSFERMKKKNGSFLIFDGRFEIVP